jgi:hypothetical protein
VVDGRWLATVRVFARRPTRPCAACPCVASPPFFAVVTPVSAAMIACPTPRTWSRLVRRARPAETSLVGIYSKADTGTRGS